MRISAFVLTTAFALPADAAVRICKDEISSGIVAAGTELEGKRKALDIWRTKAQQHGAPFSAWRIAADKILTCLAAKNTGFECYARARPCTIDHAPAKRELREKRIEM